ncbi:MAG TPA: LLM class flavin-dependent oxidoreductase [Streptosporangiaceae bacterium]|nr:LLM class flavin-dependent oxidoreductase [Streptosporangiaceae bacterium]
MPVSFGIKTSQMGLSYPDILRVWREADGIGLFEHAWLWDHMVPLRGDVRGAALEAWTLLAALAAQTQRLRLGVIVTSNRLRPPAVLAKMAATVDVISGGRLVFGIGAGGAQIPGAPDELMHIVHREFGGYGIPVVPAAEAGHALGEACALIRRMWAEDDPFDFAGRYYQLRGAICEPKPVQRPHPPVLIGAGGEQITLRVVAEHANVWNCPARDAAEFRRKSRVLDEHCAAIGRDPAEITRSMQVIVRRDDPAAARGLLLELIEAGVTHLVLAPAPPWPDTPARWLADEVAGPVAAEAAIA